MIEGGCWREGWGSSGWYSLSAMRGVGEEKNSQREREREREHNSCQIRPADKISELAVIRREKMYLACNELNCY